MAKDKYQEKQEMDAHNERMRRRMAGLDEKTGQPIPKPTSGGGGTSCFPKGTLIATPCGLSDISTLREGDQVTAFARKSNSLQVRRILKKISHGESRLWSIHFSDGTMLRTTSVHSFSVKAKWIRACNILPGATVTCVDGNNIKSKTVVRSEPSGESEPVFNLIVEGDFTFVADGMLAHSFSYLRGLRMLAWHVIGMFSMSPKLADLGYCTCAARSGRTG